MNLQFITDTNGHKNGVLLTLHDWEKIEKDLEAYERLKDIPILNRFAKKIQHSASSITGF